MPHGVFAGMFAQRTYAGAACSADQFAPPEVTLAEVAASREVDRSFEFALDALPCNAMFCDRDLILRYLNRSSRKTLLSFAAVSACARGPDRGQVDPHLS